MQGRGLEKNLERPAKKKIKKKQQDVCLSLHAPFKETLGRLRTVGSGGMKK